MESLFAQRSCILHSANNFLPGSTKEIDFYKKNKKQQ